jgi:hypothetical protein
VLRSTIVREPLRLATRKRLENRWAPLVLCVPAQSGDERQSCDRRDHEPHAPHGRGARSSRSHSRLTRGRSRRATLRGAFPLLRASRPQGRHVAPPRDEGRDGDLLVSCARAGDSDPERSPSYRRRDSPRSCPPCHARRGSFSAATCCPRSEAGSRSPSSSSICIASVGSTSRLPERPSPRSPSPLCPATRSRGCSSTGSDPGGR